jgi:hypothetical protein
MRANRLLAAAALLLAGCAPEEQTQGNSGNAAAAAPAAPAAVPTPSSPAPAPKPATEPARKDAIPAAFHGVYDSSVEACGRPSDGRLTVSADELRFHESIGSVRSVVPSRSGAIRVEADYRGEGESWRSGRDLLLSADGSKLTIGGDGTSMVRTRCPDGAL